jgi:hypothetical protein
LFYNAENTNSFYSIISLKLKCKRETIRSYSLPLEKSPFPMKMAPPESYVLTLTFFRTGSPARQALYHLNPTPSPIYYNQTVSYLGRKCDLESSFHRKLASCCWNYKRLSVLPIENLRGDLIILTFIRMVIVLIRALICESSGFEWLAPSYIVVSALLVFVYDFAE